MGFLSGLRKLVPWFGGRPPEELIPLVGTGSQAMRAQAEAALDGRRHARLLLEAMVRPGLDGDGQMRYGRLLGRGGAAAAIEQAIGWLGHDDWHAVYRAYLILQHYQGPLTADIEAGLQAYAADIASRFGPEEPLSQVALRTVAQRRGPQPPIEAHWELLSATDPSARAHGYVLLGYLGVAGAGETLAGAWAREDDPVCRRAIRRARYHLAHPELDLQEVNGLVLDAIGELDGDDSTLRSSFQALLTADDGIVPYLEHARQEASRRVALLATALIHQVTGAGEAELMQRIGALAHERDEEVAVGLAILTLDPAASRAARDLLVRLLAARYPDGVALAALEVLVDHDTPGADEQLRALVAAGHHDDILLGSAARLGACDLLEALQAHRDPAVRRKAGLLLERARRRAERRG